MEHIVLIDSYSQIFRCYYGLKADLTNSRGEPVNALYGMVRLFMQLDKAYPSYYGAACFDKGKATRRCELLPEYKAQRAPMPPELRSQIEPIMEWMAAFGWPILMEEGLEADDIISAVTHVREANDVIILTHDKDIQQLLAEEGVKIISPGKAGAWVETLPPQVVEHFGVPPCQLGDYLALVGDNVDNIKGVDGIGPKTAVKLLTDYGSLEGILAHVDELKKGKLQDNLRAGGELLERNKQLVTLDTQLPQGWNGLEGIRRQRPDWNKLCELAREQGFSSLLPKFEAAAAKATEAAQQLSLF